MFGFPPHYFGILNNRLSQRIRLIVSGISIEITSIPEERKSRRYEEIENTQTRENSDFGFLIFTEKNESRLPLGCIASQKHINGSIFQLDSFGFIRTRTFLAVFARGIFFSSQWCCHLSVLCKARSSSEASTVSFLPPIACADQFLISV